MRTPSGGSLSVLCAAERKINMVIITAWQNASQYTVFKAQYMAADYFSSDVISFHPCRQRHCGTVIRSSAFKRDETSNIYVTK